VVPKSNVEAFAGLKLTSDSKAEAFLEAVVARYREMLKLFLIVNWGLENLCVHSTCKIGDFATNVPTHWLPDIRAGAADFLGIPHWDSCELACDLAVINVGGFAYLVSRRVSAIRPAKSA
jgi:hypothetical protein